MLVDRQDLRITEVMKQYKSELLAQMFYIISYSFSHLSLNMRIPRRSTFIWCNF